MKFHSAIKGAYPDIKIISNCDGSVQQLDHPADLYDFHVRISLQRLNHYIILSMFIFHSIMWCLFDKVYTNANSMFSMAHNFDHTSRSGPKVFLKSLLIVT